MDLIYTDGGKKKAGYKGISGDCVTRSISVATGLKYKDVLKELNRRQKEWGKAEGYRVRAARTGVYAPVYIPWLEEMGFEKVFAYEGFKFGGWESIPKEGTFLVQVHRHLSCVVDGIIHDTWDPSDREIVAIWKAPEKKQEVAEKEVPSEDPAEVQTFKNIMKAFDLKVKKSKYGIGYYNDHAMLRYLQKEGYWRIQFVNADSPLFATLPTSIYEKKQTPSVDFNSAFGRTYLSVHLNQKTGIEV